VNPFDAVRSPDRLHDAVASRACVLSLSSHLAHGFTPPNGTDRVCTCLQVGKKRGTFVCGAIMNDAGTFKLAAGGTRRAMEVVLYGGKEKIVAVRIQ